METYRAWRVDNIEIRNYGGNGYNVYIDGSEIDYFTLYDTNENVIAERIKERVKEVQFNMLF